MLLLKFLFLLFSPALQAAAYYYHGLILDEGNTEKFHGMAVAALQAADEYFKESKKACEAFNAAPPLSRYSTNGIILFFFPLYFNCRWII